MKKNNTLLWVALLIVVVILVNNAVNPGDPDGPVTYNFNGCPAQVGRAPDMFTVNSGLEVGMAMQVWNNQHLARAFLYRQNGILRIATAEHVAVDARTMCTFASFRNVGYTTPLRWSYFAFYEGTDDDRLGVYTLPQSTADILVPFLQRGSIVPLNYSDNVYVGQTVAILDMDDTQTYTYWQIAEVADTWFAMTLVSGSMLCNGDSGSAIIDAPNGRPSDRVIGAVSSIGVGDGISVEISNNKTCSRVAFGIRLNQ